MGKITVPETGVYEITYRRTMREAGFSNPEGVGLIGRGVAAFGNVGRQPGRSLLRTSVK